jgi:hypothetical protein
MILGKLKNALRRQRWFDVALELSIVVLGIFIGLQVDDWNQRRQEHASDHRALALFVDELELMLVEAVVDKETSAEQLRELATATRIAVNCDASEEERTRLTEAIMFTLHWRVLDIRPSGLEDISNSGTLSRLGDSALTRAVGDLHQAIRVMEDSMALVGPKYDQAWKMLLPYLVMKAPIEITMDEYGPTRQPTAEYMTLVSQEQLCNNQAFRQGLLLLFYHSETVVYNFDTWHDALGRTLELAEVVLD